MGTLLALRIQERFDQLPPSEQKIAAVLLDRSDEILTFSATELAALSGVSKATAVRFFRHLGYTDFNDVRLQAREERNRTAPTSSSVVAAVERPEGAATISDHLQLEIAALTRTFEALRSDLLAEAAEQLALARRVWVLGLGADAGPTRLARYLLGQSRPAVQLLAEDTEIWPQELASAGPGDLIVCVASQPWPRVLSPLLEFVQAARMHAIVLTDPTNAARVRRYGGLALVCHVLHKPEASSYTAYCSMVTLLHLALISKLGASALRRADLVNGLQEQILGG